MTITPSCCHKADEEFKKLTDRENTASEEQTHVTSDLACQRKKNKIIIIIQRQQKQKKKQTLNITVVRGMVTLGYGNPLNVIIYDLGGRLMAFDEKCLYSVQSSYNTCTCSFAKCRIVCLGKFSSLSLTYLRRMFCSLSFMCKW